jgi:anti-sigma factor RsiW
MPQPECPSEETLAAFVDGGLTAEERRSVEEHLEDCAKCRTLVALVLRNREKPPESDS